MLPHSLRRSRVSRSSLVLNRRVEWRRFKTTGNPVPEHGFQNSRSDTRHSRAIHSPPRRLDFLQSLRPRKTPSIFDGLVELKKEPTSKTSSRDGPETTFDGPKTREPFPRPPSGAQTTTAANKATVPSPGLVDFFQKRLEEVKAGNQKSAVVGNREYTPNGGYSSPRRKQQFGGEPRPQSQRSGPKRHAPAGLHASMKEVRIAHSILDHPPADLSTVRQVLDQSRARGLAPPPANYTDTREETMSPIRQYVVDLRKRNLQKYEEDRAQRQEISVPSWRKSAMRSSQNPRMQSPRQKEPVVPPIVVAPSAIPDQAKMQPERAKEKTLPRTEPKVAVVLPHHDVTVSELAVLFRKKTAEIVGCLKDMGEKPTDDENYTIDVDIAEMVAQELGIKILRRERRTQVDNDHEKLMNRRKATDESGVDVSTTVDAVTLARRAPVVCIMGHVDHGKTTLMDALRRHARGGGKEKKKGSKKTKKSLTSKNGDIAGTEAGGITQVISAFQVPLDDESDAITFLDTPGHASFSAMRQSGSHAADIIVLVIAADDGVSPQTIEILNFYKSIVKEAEGGINLVVAMNKIDKPGVDVEGSRTRIENQLLEHGVVSEGISSTNEYGLPVQFIPISAKTGQGLDDLIEALLLQRDVMDLRADYSARAEGIVMDSRVEQGLGIVADCIVRWGSIQKGDVVISDTNVGKVRILKDVNDKMLQKGLPSQPVRIIGFKTTPKAGDPFVCVETEQLASELVQRRFAIKDKLGANAATNNSNSPFSQVIISGRESITSAGAERRLERYDLSLEGTGPIRIPIVVKAKADGSVAAVRDALKMLGRESSFEINVDPITEGVGVLTMGEVELAKESNAAVFCFDIKNQDKAVMNRAEAEGVVIHEFDVIYSLLDHAKEVFTDYLPAVPFETVHGMAKIQAVFSINNEKDKVAGLKVLEGHLYKSFADPDKQLAVNFRVFRDGVLILPKGLRATSLKKFKEPVESVRNGDECGLSFAGFVDFQEGDIIECFSVEMRKTFTK